MYLTIMTSDLTGQRYSKPPTGEPPAQTFDMTAMNSTREESNNQSKISSDTACIASPTPAGLLPRHQAGYAVVVASQPPYVGTWPEIGMRLITRNSVGRPLDRYLLPQEDAVLTVRRHPAILLGPIGLVLAGLIVAVLLSTVIAGGGYAIDIIWLAWGLLMLGLILKMAYWFTTYYAVTSYRMLRAKGLLVRKVSMMPLKKVTDVTIQRPARGRHFDYGKLVVTFGYEQRLWKEWNIEFVPHPEQVYAEVRRVLFPDKDKGDD